MVPRQQFPLGEIIVQLQTFICIAWIAELEGVWGIESKERGRAAAYQQLYSTNKLLLNGTINAKRQSIINGTTGHLEIQTCA